MTLRRLLTFTGGDGKLFLLEGVGVSNFLVEGVSLKNRDCVSGMSGMFCDHSGAPTGSANLLRISNVLSRCVIDHVTYFVLSALFQ